MKKVLFVDDDQGVINGLRRMLRPLRNEWQMKFVLSGSEALQILEDERYDAIISDMRMPGMNGADLLAEVRRRYPHMVRIILSGYSDQDLLLKAVRPAHQFLSKPCDAQTIKDTVQRASSLQDMLASDEIRRIVAQADTLPSLPNLYAEIMAKIQQEDVSIKEVAEIIQKDVGMTAQVLKLVNSSFFGFFKHISNPAQAATLLGLNTLKTLVLGLEIFSTFESPNDLPISFDQLWRHSTLSALFAKKIASLVSDDKIFEDDAFMAGFLHDVGILLLCSRLHNTYRDALLHGQEKGLPLWEAEREVLATTHAEIGAYLLGLWGFSSNIIESVAHHHRPKIYGDEPESLITVLHAADTLAYKLEPGSGGIIMNKLDEKYFEQTELIGKYEEWFDACKTIYEAGDF